MSRRHLDKGLAYTRPKPKKEPPYVRKMERRSHAKIEDSLDKLFGTSPRLTANQWMFGK